MEQTTTHKICTKCSTVKEIEHFGNDATRMDGKHPWCKVCVRKSGTNRRRYVRQNDAERRERDAQACARSYAKHRSERIAKMPTRDPLYNKNSFLKSTYGITLAEFDAMVEKQNGVCAVCGQPETRKSRYGGVCRLHVDHDHKTGEVRGLLCHGCNSAIGHVKEDVNVLASIIKYLTKQ